MSNRTDSDRPNLSALERWRNVCEAMAETIAEEPDALRASEDDKPFLPDELSLKMDLEHWSRPDESPEQYISRLKEEAVMLLREKRYFSSSLSPEENIAREAYSDFSIREIKVYLQRITELETAAGLPSSIKRPAPAPSTESSKKP